MGGLYHDFRIRGPTETLFWALWSGSSGSKILELSIKVPCAPGLWLELTKTLCIIDSIHLDSPVTDLWNLWEEPRCKDKRSSFEKSFLLLSSGLECLKSMGWDE